MSSKSKASLLFKAENENFESTSIYVLELLKFLVIYKERNLKPDTRKPGFLVKSTPKSNETWIFVFSTVSGIKETAKQKIGAEKTKLKFHRETLCSSSLARVVVF